MAASRPASGSKARSAVFKILRVGGWYKKNDIPGMPRLLKKKYEEKVDVEQEEADAAAAEARGESEGEPPAEEGEEPPPTEEGAAPPGGALTPDRFAECPQAIDPLLPSR